ncbi:MAG: hypothetical protein LAT56_14590, partial [Wenzhouxiangella sp.]|nr:hypothetical protein [Wenzhouxiangella sp.]
SRVIVVDPCETDSFQEKAAALFALGQRATIEFVHVKCSGDVFLDRLRVRFSRSMIRRTISSGADTYQAEKGAAPNADWFNPESSDSRILWQIRRDLEGCYPGQPARSSKPVIEPLLGLVMLQLQARGAAADGRYWNLDGHNIRVLRAANQPLHEVEKVFSGEIAPAIAPDFVIAVGAEPFSLPPDIARGGGSGSIVGGNRSKWLCRSEAEEALNL